MKKLLIILLFFVVKGYGQFTVPSQFGFNSTSGPSCDADATAWVDSTGITDATTKTAMCNFVKNLKDSTIYTKVHAGWFLAAGSASAAKWNMVNPSNTDGAFRLTFSGIITFATTGATSNGTTGYADTHMDISATLTTTSGALWFYSRTNSNAGSPYDMGSSNDASEIVKPTYVISRYSTNNAYAGYGDNSYLCTAFSSDSRGFFGANQLSTTEDLVKNGVSLASLTNLSPQISSNTIYILASNAGGTASFFSVKECAFAAITDGLTSTEWRKFYNCVQAFMTALGINV